MQINVFGGSDEPVDVAFEKWDGTVFIRVNGELVGGLSFDRNNRGVISMSLNENDSYDGEWVMSNPIFFQPAEAIV
jgi:hypothetical protein